MSSGVKASSLFQAVALALRTEGGSVATDGFRPIKVFVFDVSAEYEVKLKDFMAWLDRRGNCPQGRDRPQKDQGDLRTCPLGLTSTLSQFRPP